ncbi:MAG TPA: CHASE2 domain-containing protein, partial [Sphingomicrobium sp.]|nr:CHASE2 domain-containing protein [Sphingomicrobium sp.]
MTGLKSGSDRKRPDRRLVFHWMTATLVALLVTLAAGDRMQRGVFDSWQAAMPRDLSVTDVRVVLIDDRSVEAVGPWQWPRYYLARLTEELAARKAKVIAFDIIFPEHDRVGPESFVSLYPELSPESAAEVKALMPMDEMFGRVIGSAPVVLAHAGVAAAPVNQPPLADAPIVGQLPSAVDSWPAELAAIPELEDVALGTGLVNVRPDIDGAIRSVPLAARAGGKPRLGFATEIARNAVGADVVEVSASNVRVGDREIPVDRHGRMRLHYGNFPMERVTSAADILGRSPRLASDEFEGKPVLIGLSAEGTADIAATPLAAEEFGPLIQAQAIDAILRGGWLVRPSWAGPAEWAAAALLALLALGNMIFGRNYRILLAVTFAALPAVSWFAFAQAATLIDPVRPMLIGAGALAGVATGLFSRARSERERLREALVQERIAAAATEGELQAARAIQLGMVPRRERLRSLDQRVDLDALLEPAKSIGGDFYDAVGIGDDLIGFVIADVTGKGVPAALYMAMSKALTSAALSRLAAVPGAIASAINSELLKDDGEALGVAMLLAILDLRTGELQMFCAGHEDPLLRSTDGALHRIR